MVGNPTDDDDRLSADAATEHRKEQAWASRGRLCKLVAQPGGKGQVFKKLHKAWGLTATPILPGIESQQAWEEHRDGILQSIAPVDYLVSQREPTGNSILRLSIIVYIILHSWSMQENGDAQSTSDGNRVGPARGPL